MDMESFEGKTNLWNRCSYIDSTCSVQRLYTSLCLCVSYLPWQGAWSVPSTRLTCHPNSSGYPPNQDVEESGCTEILNIHHSLAPGKWGCNFISSNIQTYCSDWNLEVNVTKITDDDNSTLVQVMAWCLRAPSHYPNQCPPRSVMQYAIIWCH